LNEQLVLANSSDPKSNAQIRKYLDLVRRRKSWVILICLGISVCFAVVVLRLPNVYRAETSILVNPQKINEGIASTSGGGGSGYRISMIRQQVMSPTQLVQLVDELKMYPELRGQVTTQGLVARMQSATTIEFQDSGRQGSSLVHIAFTDIDPDQAARAANRIASLFIERNIKAREQEISGASQLLATELNKTKQQLEAKEHTLQGIKSRYVIELAESKQPHLRAMKNLRDQLQLSQEKVDRDRQAKVHLQSMAAKPAPPIVRHAQSSAPASALQARLQKLEGLMKDMVARFGPNYPDVRKLRNEINQLKAETESEKSAGDVPDLQAAVPGAKTYNPTMEAEIKKLDQDIEDQTRAQAELRKQIQSHVDKLQQAPVLEQQIAEVMSDYDSLRNHYSELQEKRLSARMEGGAGEHFEVLGAAGPPESPNGPKRTIMIIGGVFLGLFCGLGAAFLAEMSDGSVRDEREASQIFGKTVLAGIPKITSSRERAWARLRLASLTFGTAALASAFGVIISRFLA
jgi:succinoglycan biosynthesis transport protein ExoP